MRLLDVLRGADRATYGTAPSLNDWLSYFTYNGSKYPLGVRASMSGSSTVSISEDFVGYVQGIHRRNGVVAAAVVTRGLLLSQLRFKWRSEISEDNGKLFGNSELQILERPSPDLTRPEMLMLAENYASYAGNAYFYRDPSTNFVRLLRPDWVDVILKSDTDPDDPQFHLDARIVGYSYRPGGRRDQPAELLPRSSVAHWKPEPDPEVPWRGESWVSSVVREIIADGQATEHLSKFYDNAATPNLIFKLPEMSREQAVALKEAIDTEHTGSENAYKNLYVGGGADVMVVGANVQQLSYRETQGAHETRFALRSRVPAVVLGIAEGLGGSSLNQGNYNAARRMLADGWFSPTADNLCASLERILSPPVASELSFDPARILFLQEDQKDAAEIVSVNVGSITRLVQEGYTPKSAAIAVATGDVSMLKHTGLVSVQLQKPGANSNTADAPVGGATTEVEE